MNISTQDLAAQATTALAAWPWIPAVEDEHGLPRWLLIAVASRETNCVNEAGDPAPRPTDPAFWPGKPAHAWSPWQIDMNSGGTPDLLTDPRQAAEIAAGMLAAHHARFGDWKAACSAYNAGEGGAAQGLARGDSDLYTAGHDYGADVLARLAWLQASRPGPPAHDCLEPAMYDPKSRCVALVKPDGSVDTFNADGSPGGHYLGGLNNHPAYNAGAGKAEGPAVAITPWDDGLESWSGYVIWTLDNAGAFHSYAFESDGRHASAGA